MTRVAVIGSGISGLSAAYYLSRKHEVTVFESDSRIGGHTHTILVGSTPVDTGFIVHNERTYPNFCRLIAELGVAKQDSDMSFGVRTESGDFEYSSRGLSGFFAQRSNWVNPRHYLLLKEILRFNREAPLFLKKQTVEVTLGEFLAQGKYSETFVERYLYAMASAVWSMSFRDMAGFPALTLLRFFENHGMLGVNTHPQWKVLKGGSHSYFDPLTKPFRDRILKGARIAEVRRSDSGVSIQMAGRPEPYAFDHVVFACHGNQILPLLADATDREREVLENFQTSRNETWLHTDATTLPKRLAARASWNYCLTDDGKVNLTYDMNRLQSLKDPAQFCVTLNPRDGSIGASHVIRKMVYHHPMYTRAAVAAQARWGEISHGRTHFCGAYWFYGFHEDGVKSALRVASTLGVEA